MNRYASTVLLVATVVCFFFVAFVEADRVGGINYKPCRKTPPKNPKPGEIIEYCPDAVVNGISVACREYWMRKAMEVQFNGSFGTPNHLCPTSFFGTVVVNHSDTSPENYHDANGNNCGRLISQSSGRRGSLDDPSNHAEVNATRVIADTYRGNGDNRAFWGQLTQYTTGESCPMCAAHQVNAGYKEIVYSTRIGDLIEMGRDQIAIPSIEIVRKQVLFEVVNPTVIIRDVLRSQTLPYFAWPFGPQYPCPSPCVDTGASGNARCQMPQN